MGKLSSKVSGKILHILGWTVSGIENQKKLPKKVFAVVPHTSNWDFALGLLLRQSVGLETYYLGKKILFRPPWGFLFRWLGGYPVDRSQHHQLVDSIVDIFDQRESFAITIAPEGTRRKVRSLKTGFYYIAKKAAIPIILTKFDAANKHISFSEPFYPTANTEEDLRYIEHYFSGVLGINPQKSFFADE